jgi:hypothetical protein
MSEMTEFNVTRGKLQRPSIVHAGYAIPTHILCIIKDKLLQFRPQTPTSSFTCATLRHRTVGWNNLLNIQYVVRILTNIMGRTDSGMPYASNGFVLTSGAAEAHAKTPKAMASASFGDMFSICPNTLSGRFYVAWWTMFVSVQSRAAVWKPPAEPPDYQMKTHSGNLKCNRNLSGSLTRAV